MEQNIPIKTYAVNLRKRIDRKKSIRSEFSGKNEFELIIYPAIESQEGAVGLWETIREIVQKEKKDNSAYFLLCEDDHTFTHDYEKKKLFDLIKRAKTKKADILIGGVSWFDYTLQIDENLFWINKFNGLQFTIVFKKFYRTLLEANFNIGDNADFKISELSNSVFVSFPFISIQKEFGYSDVTMRNEKPGKISSLFQNRAEKYRQLQAVSEFYRLQFSSPTVERPKVL